MRVVFLDCLTKLPVSQFKTLMKKTVILFLSYFLALLTSFAGKEILELKGGKGPGKGKTIVLVAGDEEYRTEESMPMLAKILSQKHGFHCKVLFASDKEAKYVDPNNQAGVRGWEHRYICDAKKPQEFALRLQ